MSFDKQKITPDDLSQIHNDSTFFVEDYDNIVDTIRSEHPEETKTEAQIEQERIANAAFDPNSQENQALQDSTAFDFDTEVTEGVGMPEGSEDIEVDDKIYDFNLAKTNENLPPILGSGQQQQPQWLEKELKHFNLNANGGKIHEREEELKNKLKSLNLDETLEAFQEINADETLTEIFDFNKDGKFSFRDLYDTSRMNDGKGITDAQDEELTARWLNSLETKNFRARLGALAMQLPASTRTAYMIDGRQSRLDPKYKNWLMSQNFDNNLRAGFMESAITTLNLPEQVLHWASGGRFGGADGKRFGDRISGIHNENSMASMMMNPHKAHWADGVGHEMGYWVSEAAQVTATLGWGGVAKGGGKVLLKNATKGQKLAAATKRFLTPGISLAGTTKWGKLKSLGLSMAKTGYIETFKGSMQRDLTYVELEGIFNNNGIANKLVNLVPETNIIGAQLHRAIESPLGKRLAYYIDEGYTDSLFGGGMYTMFNPLKGARFGWSALKPFRTTISKFEWSANPLSQKNSFHWWKKKQRKGADLARAAETQLELNFDPANPFTREGTQLELFNTQGRYKNIDSNANPIEGTVPLRDGPRQILNDADEIDGSVFTKPGSTDAILDPTDLAIAARHGVNGPIYEKLTKEFVEDSMYAKQLKSLDTAGRTVGNWGEGTLKRVSDLLEGRNAELLSPEEFWGKDFVNQKLVAGSIEELDDIQKGIAEKLFVADSVNASLFSQLRDLSAATSDALGKQDIFTVDGAMSRVANNLAAGLSNVKRTRLTWSLLTDRMKANDGKISKEMFDEVDSIIAQRGIALHDETIDGVRLMMQFMKKSDAPELADALLDVFKVSNKIHNWKDFDAWMRQKISGGEFNGKVKTGALIHELQGVMVNSILSGPKTPLRAILGTTTNAYLNAINEYAGAVLRAPFTGDIVSRKASLAKLKGMVEILPEAWQVFKENWNGKFAADFANIRTRYSEAPSRSDINWKLFGEWTERNGTAGDQAAFFLTNNARTLNNNKLLSWSPRALAATDDTFKWLMARVRSKEIGMRQALEEAGPEWKGFDSKLMNKAEDYHYRNLLDSEGNLDFSKDAWLNKQFKEITLTSELGGFSKKLDGLLNETPLLKPFYLFARTGINGLNLSFKNTPLLGALHKESIDILSHSGTDFTPLMKYGIENANDLANARNLFAGRQAVGATVVTGMGMMYQAGQLTGNGPADRELKQSWINAGWKPNHIYFGNVGFNYASLEPFNVIFSSIADIGDNIELMGSEWAEKRLQAVAFVLGRGLTSKTYMSGLDQLMQVVQMKPGAWNKTAANVLNNSIPLAGMRNEFGKWVNPHMKELNSDMFDSIRNRNQLTEKIAGKPLPLKYDLLNGKPINNWNIIGRSFNAISPVQLDIRNNSAGRDLLRRSNYDLKTTTYSYSGYSLARNAHARSHFQNAIGSVPITFRGRTFKNLEEALGYASTLKDVQISLETMEANQNNPAKWDVNPNDYIHNTIIDRLFVQAKSKAWAIINNPSHPGYEDIMAVKAEEDGQDARTRDTRNEILDLANPRGKFPK
mgnify:CR=1 FL=1